VVWLDIGVRSILFCSIVSIKHHLEYLGGCIFSKFEQLKKYILFSPSSMNPSYSVIMVYGVSSSWTRRISTKDSIQKLLNEIRHCVVFAVLLYVWSKETVLGNS
jgi:hypothetical protein